MSNIVFIVQQLSQPRCIKRIQHFKNSGHNCIVFGFNNGLYEDNLKKLNFKIEEEWKIDKGLSRLKKIKIYRKHIKEVTKKIDKDDIIYTFGFEIGSIVSFLWQHKYIYEEADVSASRIKNKIFREFLLTIDRRIIKKSILTIFTSEGFSKYIFNSVNPYKHKTIFIHNKLHEVFNSNLRPEATKCDISSIKFGFVGLIRYPNTIIRFAKVIAKHFPLHEFHFFGEEENNILNNFNWCSYSNIKFHGRFKNPEDLASIYSKFDINIVSYDPTSINVQIAEPNKLYESIYFNKPIVVSQDTFLCHRVKNLEVGFCIDALTDSSIITFVNSIEDKELKSVQENCSSISGDALINNPEIDMAKIQRHLNK